MQPPAHAPVSSAATLAVALLAGVPALLALAVFGVIETPDSPGYVAYAAQLREGAIPTGLALLREAPAPVTLFRMGGYPALLAAAQWALPEGWRLATVLQQVVAGTALAAGAFQTALGLGATRFRAAVAALLPTLGFSVVVQLCILTDALYASLAAGAALLLAARPGMRGAWLAGAMLAAATTLREATPLLALAYLPLAWIGAPAPRRDGATARRDGAAGRARRAIPACAAILVLPWLVAGAQVGWNVSRGAGPVLTTSRQTVMVQAVLPLLKRHLPLLDGPGAFDAAARATVGEGEYGRIDALHRRLFAAGLSAPDMARAASALYARAWRRYPGRMLLASLQNFRHEMLALPFQPVDTMAALMVYARWPRPEFDRLNLLWARLRGGDAGAAGWIGLDVLTRLLGTGVALLAIIGPWLPGRDPSWRLRGLWCVCAGFVGLYLPVHLEPRYLVPVVTLACVLAACQARGFRSYQPSLMSRRSERKAGLCPDPPKA